MVSFTVFFQPCKTTIVCRLVLSFFFVFQPLLWMTPSQKSTEDEICLGVLGPSNLHADWLFLWFSDGFLTSSGSYLRFTTPPEALGAAGRGRGTSQKRLLAGLPGTRHAAVTWWEGETKKMSWVVFFWCFFGLGLVCLWFSFRFVGWFDGDVLKSSF